MILEQIAMKTKERIRAAKEQLSLAEMRARALAMDYNTGFPFEKALAGKGISFICEAKKASPSKGVIAADFPYVEIAQEYERAGADAISILTEPFYFQGSNEYLSAIRRKVSIPLLRKDFTVDAYMLYGHGYARTGMSGGGIFDGYGNLIGMITGGTLRNEIAGVPLNDIVEAYEEIAEYG